MGDFGLFRFSGCFVYALRVFEFCALGLILVFDCGGGFIVCWFAGFSWCASFCDAGWVLCLLWVSCLVCCEPLVSFWLYKVFLFVLLKFVCFFG